MATYYSSYSNQYRLRLDITQGTQNTANNTSVVSWTLYLESGWNSMSVYSTYHATVNGVANPNTTQTNVTIGFNTMVTLGSGSTTVTHNADGTKSVPFSASFKTNSAVYYQGTLVTPGTMTISGTFALTTIPRYAAITSFTASINDRSATMSWTADKTISEWRYSTNSGSSYSGWITVNATSGSRSLSVSPGSTYGFRIQVKNSASGLITTSSVVSRTATKTPSTLSLSTTSQNVGSGITWTVNESYDYTHKITYAFGGTSGYILGSGSAASNTATGTWTVPTALANQIPNATSGSGTIYLYTYYGGVHVGTKTYSFTAKIPNNSTYQPTATISSIVQGTTLPDGITVYVQNKSKVKVTSTGAGKYGSTIKTYSVSVAGIGTYTGSVITSDFLRNSGTVRVTLTVTDSRGLQGSTYQDITVVAYSPPQISTFTASRSESTPINISISYNASVSSVSSQNGVHYRIRSLASGGSWGVTRNVTTGYTSIESFTITSDPDKTYTIEIYVADKWTSVTQTVQVGTAFTLIDFNDSGKSMAIGKVSEGKAMLELFGDLLIQNVGGDTRLSMEQLQGNAGIEIGNPNLVGQTYIDFHSGGGGTDWDVRMIVDGGTAYPGQGVLTLQSKELKFYATPTVSNNHLWHNGWITRGQNTSGKYIQFPDGTMIAYGRVAYNPLPITSPWGGGGTWYISTVISRTFPATFYERPAVAVNMEAAGDSAVWMNVDVSLTGFNGYFTRGQPATFNAILGWVAIGRWF